MMGDTAFAGAPLRRLLNESDQANPFVVRHNKYVTSQALQLVHNLMLRVNREEQVSKPGRLTPNR
jgi:hypothetical protein